MEIAKIDVSRADARKVYCQTLTAGMAGVEVTFSFDDAWDGLHRIATFKAGGTAKDVLLTDDRCEIPLEVLAKPCARLVVGVYGERADGTLVIPTLWAELGRVEQGVTPSGDISGKHTPEVWAQIQGQIGNLKDLNTENKETLVAALNEVLRSGADPEEVKRLVDEYLAENGTGGTVKTVNGIAPDENGNVEIQVSGGNADQSGLTAEQISALDNMFKICAYTADATDAYKAFQNAFGIGGEVEPDEPDVPVVPDEPDAEKTLTSISAVYSGGDVAVGTAISDLTGIVVTAHYSDGTSEIVTGYTLSGTIAEGSNTITVSYGGKTATFAVTGVAEEEPLYGVFWPPKGRVLDWNVPEWDDVDNFAYTGNTGSEYVNAGLPGGTFVRLDKLQGTVYIRTLTKNQYGVMEQGCYQVYANSDGEIETGGFTKTPHTVYRQFGGKTPTIDVNGTTYYFMMFKFEIPAGQSGYFVSTPNAMSAGYFVSSDLTGIDDDYKKYYTLFGFDPSDRITEPATEVV